MKSNCCNAPLEKCSNEFLDDDEPCTELQCSKCKFHAKPRKQLTERLNGQRLGQALWNAILMKYHYKLDGYDNKHELVARYLFYTSDEDLRKLLNDYLREL